jgi:hypothetical protein
MTLAASATWHDAPGALAYARPMESYAVSPIAQVASPRGSARTRSEELMAGYF